jgi:hypothetical protein
MPLDFARCIERSKLKGGTDAVLSRRFVAMSDQPVRGGVAENSVSDEDAVSDVRPQRRGDKKAVTHLLEIMNRYHNTVTQYV